MLRLLVGIVMLASAAAASAEPTFNPPQPSGTVVVPTGGKAGGVVGSRQP